MTDARPANRSEGPDPKGHGGGAVGGAAHPPAGTDPIFHAAEPRDATPRSTVLVWQFFLFPLIVVAAAVGVFVFFGAIGGSARDPKDLVRALRSGSENEQKQAAQQLARLIANERTRVDAGRDAGRAPFYADPEVREGLLAALRTALAEPSASAERRMWLARAVGRIAPPGPSAEGRAIADLLLSILYPGPEGTRHGDRVRLAAVEGLLDMESRDAEPALLRAAADPDDKEVRVVAVNGLALLGLPKFGSSAADDPRTAPLLRERLEDEYVGVRVNAAVALGLRGDGSGVPLLARSLSRDGLEELGIHDVAWQRNQLANALRAAVVLKDPSLEPLVERLAKDDPDPTVRKFAAEVLGHWRNP